MKIKYKNVATKLYVQLILHNNELIIYKIECDCFRKITHLHSSNSQLDVSYRKKIIFIDN